MNNKLAIAAALAVVAGISAPLSAHTPHTAAPAADTTTVPNTNPNAPLLNASTVSQFIQALPNWGSVNPVDVSKQKDTAASVNTGVPAGATRIHHDIYNTPDQIVTFSPVDGFWLGAIVQNQGLSSLGTIREVRVAATKRAPLTLTSDLSGAHSVEIASPSRATIGDALDAMRAAAKRSERDVSSKDELDITENINAKQTATDLKLDVSYLSQSVQASLNVSHTQNEHTVTVAFMERAYTVTADFQNRSARKAFFNDQFTLKSAKKLVPASISMDDPPAYVKSITYGRMLVFNLTSTASADDMEADLQASLHTPTGIGGSGGIGHKQVSQAAKFKLRATQFGGPQIAFSKVVPDASTVSQPDAKDTGGTFSNLGAVLVTIQNYLDVPASPDTMIPISYTVNSLKEDSLAAMPVTTSYDVDTYANNPTGATYQVKIYLTADQMGASSSPYDVYGQLTVNGTTWWERSSDNAYSWGHNTTFNITDDTTFLKPAANSGDGDFVVTRGNVDRENMKFVLHLKQHGNFFTGDYSLGDYTINVGDFADWLHVRPSHEYVQSFADNNNHKTTIHFHLEKVGDIM